MTGPAAGGPTRTETEMDASLEERVTELERRNTMLLVAIEAGGLAISKLTDAIVNIENYLRDEAAPSTGGGAPEHGRQGK